MPPQPGLPMMDQPPGVDPNLLDPNARRLRRMQEAMQYGEGGVKGMFQSPLPEADVQPYAQGHAPWAAGMGGAMMRGMQPGLQPDAPSAAAPGIAAPPAPPPKPDQTPADEAQWGGAGSAVSKGRAPAAAQSPYPTDPQTGEAIIPPAEQAAQNVPRPGGSKDLPQPLANPKPSGISAQEQAVLDAQDASRKEALLGDIQQFQGGQQPYGAYKTTGSGDTGGLWPDQSNQLRGNELMRLLGMPVPTQQGSDAYSREKFAGAQTARDAKRAALLEKSKGPLTPLEQQDLLRQYNALGIEEATPPDRPPPLPPLRVQMGDQEQQYRFPDPGQKPFTTPGTPEFEETQRAGVARGALSEALHSMPNWLKLEEAKLHVQGQQEAAHNATAERMAAAQMNKSPEEQAAGQEAIKEGQELRMQLTKNAKLPEAQRAEADAAAHKVFTDKAAARNKGLEKIPDEAEMKVLKGKLETAATIDQLLEFIQGQSTALGHGPTRKMISNAIQQSPLAKTIPNLGTLLEDEIVKQARIAHGQNLAEPGQQVGIAAPGPGDIRVERMPGNAVKNVYNLYTPWRNWEKNVSPIVYGGSVRPTPENQAKATLRARGAGTLLKLMHEHGYPLQ